MNEDLTSVEAARRHVQILEKGRAAFDRRDFDALMPLIADDFELHPGLMGAFTGAATYRGKDGARRYWEDLMEVIEDFQLEAPHYSVWGEYLVALTKVRGHGKTSGIDIDEEMTFVWRLRDDQIIWGATFFTRREALDAIGASEAELSEVT